jgi:CheY-like chemotaxis protein
VGIGSTFWFELPATCTPVQAAAESEVLIPTYMRPALLIEDDDAIAEVLSAHLQQDNFGVVRARSLTEAQTLLHQYNPLFILLDLTLPDGDGLDLLSKLNDDAERRHIPVVVVTGRDQAGSIKCGHPALIDWISKPIDEAQLHDAFDAARQKLGPAKVLLVEDDSAARQVLRERLDSLGVRCLEANDGAAAITLARDKNPDLIILDLSIPPPDGFAVVDILSQESNKHKPLIVYTALDLTTDQKQLLRLGLTAHLTKSVDSIEEVIGTVKEFLDGLIPPRALPGVESRQALDTPQGLSKGQPQSGEKEPQERTIKQ